MKDALSKKQIENSQKISGLEETIQLQKDTLESQAKKLEFSDKEN